MTDLTLISFRFVLPAFFLWRRLLQACNKAQTTWNPEITDESQLDEFACHDVGPMHTTDAKGSENPTNVKGAFRNRVQMNCVPS